MLRGSKDLREDSEKSEGKVWVVKAGGNVGATDGLTRMQIQGRMETMLVQFFRLF